MTDPNQQPTARNQRQAAPQPQKPTLPLRLHSLVGGTSYILDANSAWVCTGPTPMLERILEAFALAATTEQSQESIHD